MLNANSKMNKLIAKKCIIPRKTILNYILHVFQFEEYKLKKYSY
jgi:hypothetical protein